MNSQDIMNLVDEYLYNNSKMYRDYNYDVLPKLTDLNNEYNVKNPVLMNNIRHKAGAAIMANRFGAMPTFFMGLGKEIKDNVTRRNLNEFKDSFIDLTNNIKGIKLHLQNPNTNDEDIYKKTLYYFSKPAIHK